MFDQGSLYRTLHRTYNMHTADWNTKVIRRAMDMLGHKVLDFDGIYNVRVAFTTYEHSDMKGMLVNKRLLLRTLKLCGRVISPMKLLHRIKHMRAHLEEKGRIQLYEFFNLILWCEWYPAFDPEKVESASGKNDYLFRVVDFHRLLSHHDERMFNRLDAQYLKEERNFGREAPGPRSAFADPVVDTGHRIGQAEYHKEKYRHLKQEVVESEKRVHCAHAGSVRDRPISAPDLNGYKLTKAETGGLLSGQFRKRIQSAPSRGLSRDSERPHVTESMRSPTPRVVTPGDLSDVEAKMKELNFDISTLDCKIQLQLEAEMDFFIPGYKDRLPKQKQEEAVLPEAKKKPRLWTAERIKDLTYPHVALPPTHAKTCDARFRGWDDVNTQPGHHVVLDTRTHEQSEKGKLLSKLERRTMTPVLHVHPGYIVRYNKRANFARTNHLLRKHPCTSDVEPKGLDNGPRVGDPLNEGLPEEKVADENDRVSSKTYTEMSESQMASLSVGSKHADSTVDGRQQPREVNDGQVAPTLAQLVPVPYMEHSGPKIVNVGQIGTISLLENIQEAAELEDRFTTCSTINHHSHEEDASHRDTQRTKMADVHKLSAFDDADAREPPRGQNISNLTNHRNCGSHPSQRVKSPHGKLREFCSAPVRGNDPIPTSPGLLGEKMKVNEKRSMHTSRETLTSEVPGHRIGRWRHSRAVNPDAGRTRGISGTSKMRPNKAGRMNTSENETIDSKGLQKRNAGNSSAEQTADFIECLREEIPQSVSLDGRSGDELDTVNRFVQMPDAPANSQNLNSKIHLCQLKPNNFTCPKHADETKITRQKARSRLIGRIQNPNYRLYGNRNGIIYAV
ncbi:unnamed protein product [Lymnaea stagnalis]|uniref:Uncharacterized protein n=1 Tax=Lymnaea stagnalis TaxID=6523 RepID=A0AAV2IQ28_LYMST